MQVYFVHENLSLNLDIFHSVCDLVISHCPENIHIPEKLIIKIWERRGYILAAFLLAITFKELRQTVSYEPPVTCYSSMVRHLQSLSKSQNPPQATSLAVFGPFRS